MLSEKSQADTTLRQAIPGPDDIVRRELDNGIVVLVRENFTAQSVVITGALGAGAIAEVPEKEGIASFMASALMRGTASRSFADIHEELESVGANLQISSGMQHVGFGAKSLGEDLPLLLDLLNDTLRNPSFPHNQVERLRGEILTGLKMRQDSTRYMAALKFRQLAYPYQHPYHRNGQGTPETVGSLSIQDLHKFHQTYLGPKGMILVVVGNMQTDEALRLVEDTLGDWQNPNQQPFPDLPKLESLDGMRYEATEIPGKSQADIVLGVPGPSRDADDFQAARLANNILGLFGMYGRLGKTVREEQGLAYYSYSQLDGGHGPGPWRVIAGVDPSDVKQAVHSIRREIQHMVEEPVSQQDLEDNRSNLTGSLPLQLESNEGVAGAIFNMERHNLGLDYLRRYADIINQLDAEQVQAAMQRYWSGEHFALAVAGPKMDKTVVDI